MFLCDVEALCGALQGFQPQLFLFTERRIILPKKHKFLRWGCYNGTLRSGRCCWTKTVCIAPSQVHMESFRNQVMACFLWESDLGYFSAWNFSVGVQDGQNAALCHVFSCSRWCHFSFAQPSKLFLCWIIILPSTSYSQGYYKAACEKFLAVTGHLLYFSIFPCQVLSSIFVFSLFLSLGSFLTLHWLVFCPTK